MAFSVMIFHICICAQALCSQLEFRTSSCGIFSALPVTVLSVTTIIVSPSLVKVKDHCYRKKGGEGGWSSATCTKKATLKMNEKLTLSFLLFFAIFSSCQRAKNDEKYSSFSLFSTFKSSSITICFNSLPCILKTTALPSIFITYLTS